MIKKEKIKEGLELIANNECFFLETGFPTLTIGKKYKILGVDYENDEFFIEDDEGSQHYFTIHAYTDFFECLDETFNNGWIKILSEDDLPKESFDCYFITNHSDNTIMKGFFNSHSKSIYGTHKEYNINEITHYQPIEKPELPIY